jgi:alkanesulfonate monooxygenase SsuD/methylene tetrahydromethanopterin reductase-like flavin-dependent oxidoreductase (luciferase family)
VILGTFGSPQGRQRVADFGDGWIPIGFLHGARLRDDIADLNERLQKNGRDLQSVPISMFDIYETSTEDLTRFRDLGVIDRAISRCPTEDRDTVLRWLDGYADTARRLT